MIVAVDYETLGDHMEALQRSKLAHSEYSSYLTSVYANFAKIKLQKNSGSRDTTWLVLPKSREHVRDRYLTLIKRANIDIDTSFMKYQSCLISTYHLH